MEGSALIGASGFVGSNLRAARSFDHLFGSHNFQEMAGRKFDKVYCAGVRAVKWLANKEPEQDREAIQTLSSVLEQVEVRQFILISTIDVYPVTKDADESYNCHQLPNHPYGAHRLAFEDFCRAKFDNCLTVRLPALFGRGLKKNVIYDLMNDNCLEAINPNSLFQYYDLARLEADIGTALRNNLHTVNFFTEPLETNTIIKKFFPGKIVGAQSNPPGCYNLYTRYAKTWGQSGSYLISAEEVLSALGNFLKDAKAVQ